MNPTSTMHFAIFQNNQNPKILVAKNCVKFFLLQEVIAILCDQKLVISYLSILMISIMQYACMSQTTYPFIHKQYYFIMIPLYHNALVSYE